jgi:molecular chaperone DnaK
VLFRSATQKEQTIRIEGAGGLDTAEIDRMVSDAETFASEDRTRRELIDKRNALDSLLYQAEKTLGENAENLSDEDKAAVESVLESAKKDLDSDDVALLDAAHQRVETELHRVAEQLYKSQAEKESAPPADAGEASRTPEDDVIDAEYTEAASTEPADTGSEGAEGKSDS